MQFSRRFLSMVLAVAMIVSMALTGCSAPGTQGSQPTDTSPTKPPAEDYTLPLEDGYNQLTLYWSYSGTYENCDIWIWWGDKAGQGYLFRECDYGGKVVINVPEGVEQVGFIVRKDCSEPGGSSWGSATKDYEQDRFAVIDGKETEIYLKTGDASQYISNDGGKTLTMIKKFAMAGMVDEKKIRYNITPKAILSDLSAVKVYDGDREVKIESISTLGKNADSGYITVAESLDLSKQYRVEIAGYGSKAVVPTDIFDSEFFAQTYHYDGDDLGAVVNGENTTFKVWAPTASQVVLNLFTAGNGVDAYKTVQMVKGEKGVWSHTEPCGHGTYYTYTVTTSVGTQEAVDPYAKAAGVNGKRGMVVDLPRTDPEGWDGAVLADPIEKYSDAIIWEVHVRDFSNKISSSQYKGKYLAFTERGLVNEHGQAVGVDYLVNLGVTHVHLLPVYDYASVDETHPDDQFNWGYDPENYNVPEGSYSTDPYHGEVRIKEFKQMVMALHEAGIGVIMDAVYNHTYDANSSFNKIVPYYYYRYTNKGVNSNASGCGNDTASERYMFGKFMVDSVKYWVEEYNLDGVRFDLMGLHDLETMKNIEAAVHTIDPDAIIYGEGWTMGATVDGSSQANQGNISKVPVTNDASGSIAVFNDVIRDGLKGSVFDEDVGGYINGNASANLRKIQFGISGGSISGQTWRVDNAMVINYMSAHDNHTLWDKLAITNPDSTVEERMAMNRVGAAILMISQGTPFMQAGEEMLRTKDGEHNSYNSSDEINNINWDALTPNSYEYAMMQYYKGLLEMRKTYGIFTSGTDVTVTFTDLKGGATIAEFVSTCGEKAIAVINPTSEIITTELDGEYKLVANGTAAGSEAIEIASGEISVSPMTVSVFVK